MLACNSFMFGHIYLATGHRFSMFSAPLCLRLLIFIKKFLFLSRTNYALFLYAALPYVFIILFCNRAATFFCGISQHIVLANTVQVTGKTQQLFIENTGKSQF